MPWTCQWCGRINSKRIATCRTCSHNRPACTCKEAQDQQGLVLDASCPTHGDV